jgi:hypothetical protein
MAVKRADFAPCGVSLLIAITMATDTIYMEITRSKVIAYSRGFNNS